MAAARSACRGQPGDAAHVSAVRRRGAAARPPADGQRRRRVSRRARVRVRALSRGADAAPADAGGVLGAAGAARRSTRYLDSGRRWWLGVYGAAWLLQALANLYSLYFFSALVGAVGAVVRDRGAAVDDAARHHDRDAASPPSRWRRHSPPMSRVHARHGFERSADEAQVFSADLTGLLCAPPETALWGWLQVGCRPEAALFPGARAGWCWSGSRSSRCGATAPPRPRRRAPRARARVPGRWSAALAAARGVERGVVRAVAHRSRVSSAPRRPRSTSRCSSWSAPACWRSCCPASVIAAARQQSVAGFYLLAALRDVAAGARPHGDVHGRPARACPGRSSCCSCCPGGDGLRAPAPVLADGDAVPRGRGGARRERVAGAPQPARGHARSPLVLAAGLLSDGWATIPAAPAPAAFPDPVALRGQTVLQLPVGNLQDFAPQFLAVAGGWRSVNGYSGYEPRFYEAVRQGARFEVDGLFQPFRARGDLFVVVNADQPRLRALVERQPGAVCIGDRQRHSAVPAAAAAAGARVHASAAPVAHRGRHRVVSRGRCGGDRRRRSTPDGCAGRSGATEWFQADLGAPADRVAAVRYTLGESYREFPRVLVIETSLDGQAWEPAWDGDVIAPTIEGSLAEPLTAPGDDPVCAAPGPLRPAAADGEGRPGRAGRCPSWRSWPAGDDQFSESLLRRGLHFALYSSGHVARPTQRSGPRAGPRCRPGPPHWRACRARESRQPGRLGDGRPPPAGGASRACAVSRTPWTSGCATCSATAASSSSTRTRPRPSATPWPAATSWSPRRRPRARRSATTRRCSARILRDPSARALYLFPTKALAQDQLAELHELSNRLSRPDELEIGVFTYDGDTPQDARRAIRGRAHVVLSNPDMVHSGILPHHPRWAKLFENLRFVVIDELHAYRGVFGSHLTNVLRRLRRLCRHYGSNPTFICSSATIANPRELAEALVEQPFELVSESGAPRGEKVFLFVNPPVVNQQLGIRRSYLAETRRIAAEFLKRKLQLIVFAQSRLATEILTTYLKDDFAGPPGAPRRDPRLSRRLPAAAAARDREGAARGHRARGGVDQRARARHRHRRARRVRDGRLSRDDCRHLAARRARRPPQRAIGGGAGGQQRAARSVHRAASVVFLRRLARARADQPRQPAHLRGPREVRGVRAAVHHRRVVRPPRRAGGARRAAGERLRPSQRCRGSEETARAKAPGSGPTSRIRPTPSACGRSRRTTSSSSTPRTAPT